MVTQWSTRTWKKNTTISHSLPRWDLFLVVLLVAGYSVIWASIQEVVHTQQETQSSRWWGVSMSWCHSGGFHEFSRKISRALDGSFWFLTWPFWVVRFSGCEPTHRTGTHPKQPVTKTREKRHPFHCWRTGDCPNGVLGVCCDFM